jgi:histidinol-phosphate aminotransferase
MADLAFRPRPRPSILESRPYEPGRSPADLPPDARAHARVVRLASNENPLGPSPRVAPALDALRAELGRYPDPAGRRLRAAIASRLGVSPDGIVLGGGSDQILGWLAQVFLDRDRAALVSTHTFPTYRLVALAAGAPVLVAPSRPENDARPFAHDLEALVSRARDGTGVLFLDNPGNPVGCVFDRRALATLLETVPADVLVVIDEAYIDYVEHPEEVTVVPLLARYPSLVVTRTFSKIYGLAGARLGFGLMHPEAASLLARIRLPFAVSAPALAAGEAAWSDEEHYRRSRALVLEERPRLAAELTRRGWRVLPSAANFLTARPPVPSAALFDGLFREGVIVRPLRGAGIESYLRITIGTREENDQLLAALDRLGGGS